jgi:hypothetical protein
MTEENEIIKQYLVDNPYDPNDPSTLPPGWEVRFNRRGRFYQYKTIEEVERRNNLSFSDEWEKMKASMQEGDEVWLYGNDVEILCLVRNNEIIKEICFTCL